MYNFNSIKVRLILFCLLFLLCLIVHFNSIKVRLILVLFRTIIEICRFQFHKGSIDTHQQPTPAATANTFQFHKGSIDTLFANNLQNRVIYFNSIKVRLILAEDEQDYNLLLDFNSIKVRLILHECKIDKVLP